MPQKENSKPESGEGEEAEKENEVGNDNNRPVDCIKCNLLSLSLDTMDDFNRHMNDHWREDKCCPLCGKFNSRRFNFKEHLKVHTGEKPYRSWLPDGCSKIFRLYVFGPSGFCTMAPLKVVSTLTRGQGVG